MIDDVDIWRAADLLIKRHGDDAGMIAAQRADELLNHRDLEGYAIWRCILASVSDLTRTSPAEDERVN